MQTSKLVVGHRMQDPPQELLKLTWAVDAGEETLVIRASMDILNGPSGLLCFWSTAD